MRFPEIILPGTLDIIKINDRWAQVGSPAPEDVSFFYLEDNSHARINPIDYDLVKLINRPLRLMPEGALSKKEIDNVRWGPEQESYPELKMQVKVFGVYERRSRLILLYPSSSQA